ncbi:hypothetical protein NGRA_1741 [Nosema granulosis]|uniref:FLYWCH-type domain-containing protein n=1 Tax=Nosema granulosis TaxID=83296 RepID=A0A9P6H0M9_9MICR|nr:hypothetical protein NGRA_1741 [Nosema granulosis]
MVEVIWVRGGNKLDMPVLNGYLFHFHRYLDLGVASWRCAFKGCNVHVHFKEDGTIEISKHHEHTQTKVLKLKCFDYISVFVEENPFETGHILFNKATNKLSTFYEYNRSYLQNFPYFSTLKTMIFRLKREYYLSSLEELI